MRLHCVDAASTSLNHANVPVVDREALLRKAVLASLEDRTTPLWNSLIPNLDSLAAGLVNRQEQVAPSNGHTSDLSIATQQLLSRLAGGSSPEALALLLQSTGQLPTSLMHVLGSHPLIQERAGLVPLSHASSSTPDLLTIQACPLQREVGHSSFGCASGVPAPTDDRLPVSRELIPKSTDSSLVRPIAERLMPNPELSALQDDQVLAAPAMQRLFQEQSTADHSTVAIGKDARQRADAGMNSAIGSRGSLMLSSIGAQKTGSSFRPNPPDPRPALQPSIVQPSNSPQSGSDEELPAHLTPNMEVQFPILAVIFSLLMGVT